MQCTFCTLFTALLDTAKYMNIVFLDFLSIKVCWFIVTGDHWWFFPDHNQMYVIFSSWYKTLRLRRSRIVCTSKNIFGRFNFIWPSFEASSTRLNHFYFGVSSMTSSELEELICLCKRISFSFDSCRLWKFKFFTTAAIM